MCVDTETQQQKEKGKKVKLRLTGQSEMPESALYSATLTAVKKIQVDI